MISTSRGLSPRLFLCSKTSPIEAIKALGRVKTYYHIFLSRKEIGSNPWPPTGEVGDSAVAPEPKDDVIDTLA